MRITHLSYGFYVLSDADAGRLAKDAGTHLPRHGYELGVELPNGLKAWLIRTPAMHGIRMNKRGWVWAVYRRTGKEWTTYNLGKKVGEASWEV